MAVNQREEKGEEVDLVVLANEATLGALQYALTGRQTDGNDNTLWALGKGLLGNRSPQSKAAVRGLKPVVIWLFVLLFTLLVAGDDNLSSDARALLLGNNGGKNDNDDLALWKTWYSVLGFNVMQLILLVSAGLLIALRKPFDSLYQSFRALSQDLPSLLGIPLRVVVSLLTSNLVQLARIGVDIGFFFVSAAAVWYSLEAFSKISNIQPGGGEADADNRYTVIVGFLLAASQILVPVMFRERDAGKSEMSPEELEKKVREEDANDDPKDKVGINNIGGLDTRLAKDKLKIHNFY